MKKIILALLAISNASVTFAYLKPEDIVNTSKVGVSGHFVKIKAESFLMGSPENEVGRYSVNENQHKVNLTQDFEMQATEVTQLQYKTIMGDNPSRFANRDTGHLPVENISRSNVKSFIQKLNEMQDDYTYRLPTEAEWEFAARGGSNSMDAYSFGNDSNLLKKHAWYWTSDDDNLRMTGNVASAGGVGIAGSGNANGYGLYDMHGNVSEMVLDFYQRDYSGEVKQSEAYNAQIAEVVDFKKYVVRGGSWVNENVRDLRTAARDPQGFDRNGRIGFRLVRIAKSVAEPTKPSVEDQVKFMLIAKQVLTDIRRFQDPITDFEEDPSEFFNYDGESYFNIKECTFEGVRTARYDYSGAVGTRRFEFYDFPIKEFSSFDELYNFRAINLKFSSKVGNVRRYHDGVFSGDDSENFIWIHFDFDEASSYFEGSPVDRLKENFKKLQELAARNPRCMTVE